MDIKQILEALKLARPTIYYAHSMRVYHTDKEKAEVKAIKKAFPKAKIINPSELTYDGRGMEMFLKIVEGADMVAFSCYQQHLGRGVYLEVLSAQQLQKPVFLIESPTIIRQWTGSFNVIDVNWKVLYAQLKEEK